MCNALPQLQPNPHNALPYFRDIAYYFSLLFMERGMFLGGVTHIRIFFYLCMRRGAAKKEELRNR